MNLEEAVSQFVAGTSARSQLDAVEALLKTKSLNAAWRDHALPRGLDALAATVEDPDRGTDRLLAAATVGRLAAVVKSSQGRLREALASRLASPLPPLQQLDDPDNRYYAAMIWRFTSSPWMGTFLAEAAVQEEAAENARGECLEGLMSCAPDLQTVFDSLAAKFKALRFETQKPGDSMGRRVRKVLAQLGKASAQVEVHPGTAPGSAFASMVEAAFSSRGLPESDEIRASVADDALAMVDRMVRMRFSLATESTTYSVLDVVRGWFGAHGWPGVVEQCPSARLVRDDLLQALRILVRAGVTDDVLYRHLSSATGSERQSREAAVELASTTPGLHEDVQGWLRGTPVGRESALAAESQDRSADEVFGDLLLEARGLTRRAELMTDEVIPELEIVAPFLAGRVAEAIAAQASTTGKIEMLAARRALRTRWNAGEVVEFSALEHELVGGARTGIRHVRVLSPLVESVPPTGVRRVVRKALVEPARAANN